MQIPGDPNITIPEALGAGGRALLEALKGEGEETLELTEPKKLAVRLLLYEVMRVVEALEEPFGDSEFVGDLRAAHTVVWNTLCQACKHPGDGVSAPCWACPDDWQSRDPWARTRSVADEG